MISGKQATGPTPSAAVDVAMRGAASSCSPYTVPRSLALRRSAFSLAELMIAIVILGIGLLGAAMMFPVAWTKARQIAEVTDVAACTDAAISTVPLLTALSRDNDGVPPTAEIPSSFLGDVGATGADPWVHALNMGNFLAADPNPPPAGTLEPDIHPIVGDFNKSDHDGSAGGGASGTPWPEPDPHPEFDFSGGIFPFDDNTNHNRPINVALHERVYPPLPPPPSSSPPQNDPRQVVDHWWQLLQQRSYAWGVLHKQNFTTTAPLATEARTMTFYLVTLRRGSPSSRYARQSLDNVANPTTVPRYGPSNSITSLTPLTAMGAAEDVIFPAPWRIQIEILDGTGAADDKITNIPGSPAKAKVLATLSGASSGVGIAQMLPVGAFMVDELNGLVYRVANREIALRGAAAGTGALITFEEAVPAEQLDNSGDNVINLMEVVRTVWVYPPPVERDSAGTILGFDKHQPVVNIELRTITMAP